MRCLCFVESELRDESLTERRSGALDSMGGGVVGSVHPKVQLMYAFG